MVFTYPDVNLFNDTPAANRYEPPTDKTLKFAYISVINQPAMEKWWSCKKPNDFSSCTGMMAYTVKFFAEQLNMTARHVVGWNGELGRRLPNGSWTGSTLDVIENRADMSIASVQPFLCSETTCLDFLAHIRYGTLTPKPTKKLFIQIMLQPFSPAVWIGLVVSFLTIGLMLRALKNKYYRLFNWMKFFGTVLGNDIPQDTGFGEKVSQFFPLGTWYIGMAFISFAYAGLIIGSFTDPFEPRAKDLRMVLATGHKLLVSPKADTLILKVKAPSKDRTLRTFARRMKEVEPQEKDNWYFPGVDETYTNDLILVWLRLEAGQKNSSLGQQWNDFYVVDNPRLFPIPVSHRTIIFRKNFPRMKEVRKIWYNYFEHGFQAYNEKSTYKRVVERMKEQSKYTSTDGELKPIAMSHIRGVFTLACNGLAMALIAFVWEIAHNKWNNRKK